jgi:hypothetical protein
MVAEKFAGGATMRYTDLVFDLYGTLVDIHTEESDEVWEKCALYFGFYGASYTGEELKTAFRTAMQRREAKAGRSYECFPDIPFEEVMAELFEEKGICENASALGVNAAQSIVDGRKDGEFKTILELKERTSLGRSLIDMLKENGILDGIPETNQMSLF